MTKTATITTREQSEHELDQSLARAQAHFASPQPVDPRLGRWFKGIREAAPMSISELALASGIGRRRLHAIEAGADVSQKEIKFISQAIVHHVFHGVA